MAANAAAVRHYLENVIGITSEAARDALVDQGLDSFAEFETFNRNLIATTCSDIRKPGGLIPDPNGPDANGDILQVRNPGAPIGARQEARLKDAVYVAKYWSLIGRTVAENTLNRNTLNKYAEMRMIMENMKDPEPIGKVSKTFKIMTALELFPGHLRNILGTLKVPLVYVIRETSVHPAGVGPMDAQRPYAAEYSGIMEELIDRLPHSGPHYCEDNAKVFQMLKEMVQDNPTHLASIKPFERARNGRGAYLALDTHNMGTNKWEKMQDEHESFLLASKWDGKNQRYALTTHINKHRESYNALVRVNDHIGCGLPDARTRVARLLHGLTCSDVAIQSAKTTIMAQDALKADFEAAADFLLKQVPVSKKGLPFARISGVHTGGGKSGGKGKGKGKEGKAFKGKIEDRYYSKAEYLQFSKQQREELREMRHGNRDGELKDLRAQISALTTKRAAEEGESTDPPKIPTSPLKKPKLNLNQRTQES